MPSPTDAPVSPPAQVAAAEGELPFAVNAAILAECDSPRICSVNGRVKEGIRCGPCERKALFIVLARLTAAESARDEARADQKAAEDASEALEVKLRALAPHRSCACSYDSPGDVCMHHSPALSAALAESAEMLGLVRKHAVEAAKAEVIMDVAVAERDAALARAERAEKALEASTYLAGLYRDCWRGKTVRDLPEAEAWVASTRSALAHPAPAEET